MADISCTGTDGAFSTKPSTVSPCYITSGWRITARGTRWKFPAALSKAVKRHLRLKCYQRFCEDLLETLETGKSNGFDWKVSSLLFEERGFFSISYMQDFLGMTSNPAESFETIDLSIYTI